MEKVGICILGMTILCLVEANTGPSAPGVLPSAVGAFSGSKPPCGCPQLGSKGGPTAAGGPSPGPKTPPTAAGAIPPSAFGSTGLGATPPAPTYNLSTPQGVQNFLNMEGINPATLVTTNCIANGNPCDAGGQSCCLSPVFSCQGRPGMCKVVPAHVNHIPQVQQIVQTAGYSTPNPIL